MLLNDLHIDLIAVHEWSNMKLRCHTLSYGAQEAIVSMPWNQATGAGNKYLMSRKDGHQQPDLETNSKMEKRSGKHRWQKPVGHHLSQHNWRQNQTRGRQKRIKNSHQACETHQRRQKETKARRTQPAMLGDIDERRQGVKGGQARDTHARKLGDMKGSKNGNNKRQRAKEADNTHRHPNTKPDTPLGYV